MFNLIFIGAFLILGLMLNILLPLPDKDIQWAGWALAMVWSLASMAYSLIERVRHLREIESLRGDILNYINYKTVKEELTTMLEKFLGDAYPKHEKSVVDAMATTNGILISYPDLASSATFIKLTTDLSTAIHNLNYKRQSIITTCFNIKGQLLSGWEWFQLKFPEDVESQVKDANF